MTHPLTAAEIRRHAQRCRELGRERAQEKREKEQTDDR